MTSTESRPSPHPRFVIRETPTPQNDSDRFLIRPENPVRRAEALTEFDSDKTRSPSAGVRSRRPGVAELLINAEMLLSAGERSTAAHLIRQALCLDSRHPEALKKMLRCLGTREWEQPQRRTILKTLGEIEPNFENLSRYAQSLLENGELDRSLEVYFEAIVKVQEENDLLFEAYKNIGNIYVRKGDFEAAEETYHKAFTLKPDSDLLQVNLGTLAVQKEDWGTALEKFRKALEINPDNDKAWVGIGLCHQQVGDTTLAIAALENALDLAPSNRTGAHLLTNWSFPINQVERAASRLQDYLATQESDIEMSLVLIHVFCHLQKYSMAYLELERALCWAPDRADLIELKSNLEKISQEDPV